MSLMQRGVICLLGLSIIFLWQGYKFRFNRSESLPYTIYFSVPSKNPEVGQIMTFHIDKSKVTFAKKVEGGPGDYISVKGGKIYINGSEKGEINQSYNPINEGIIPADYFFVLGSHPNSFDSRYAEFGLVHRNAFRDRLWPIF